jgi:hypothetical protein
MKPADFWSERLRACDQVERLERVRIVLVALSARGGKALDFGLGTGDFSRLLLELGFTVCVDEIVFGERTVDLVLSVPAFDHIREDHELAAALDLIRSLLTADGMLLLFEYALEPGHEGGRLANDHQALRTLGRWREPLAQSSIELTRTCGMPHPVFSPSPAFLAYTRSLPVRQRKPRGTLVDPLLGRQAERSLRKFRGAPAGHPAARSS